MVKEGLRNFFYLISDIKVFVVVCMKFGGREIEFGNNSMVEVMLSKTTEVSCFLEQLIASSLIWPWQWQSNMNTM